MLELVAAPESGSSAAGANAVDNEIQAFAQEYQTQQRERDAFIETMVKSPPKAASTQRSYKSWLARWKV
jgi:hypothetical protein